MTRIRRDAVRGDLTVGGNRSAHARRYVRAKQDVDKGISGLRLSAPRRPPV
jgi:hypothetical protein